MLDFPDTAPFTSEFLQCNNYWIFALGREGDASGRLHFRPNTEISGVPGEWKSVGETGLPPDASRGGKVSPIARIDMDNDVLLAVTRGGLVYRLLNLFSQDPEKFEWRKSWGWPFDHGPQMVVSRGYREICFSSSKEWSTMWTADRDGNRHHRFIDHMYCLSDRDTLIHHNDPWTPGDWDYAFPCPEGGRLLPARGSVPGYTSGINASGGVLGFIAPTGVWTIEYDFDIAGGNPLAEYLPHELPAYEGIAPIVRIEKGSKPIRLPSAPWRSHGTLPGPCTAHIQVSPEWDSFGKVVPGPESRVIRILGLRRDPSAGRGETGYWEKGLAETEWRFVTWNGVAAETVAANLINGRAPEYGPELRSAWRGPLSNGKLRGTASLLDFGPHSNFFEGAQFVAESGGTRGEAEVYTHVQMRTSRAGRALARVRGRRRPSWLGAFLVFPTGDSAGADLLRAACFSKKGERFAGLLIRLGKRKIELIKPLVPLNADIVNWINGLFGRRVAVLRRR